mgnify:CR=1 FL=1
MAIEKHDTTENTLVPVSEKYTLTIKEAASYFNIGTKKMRRLAEDNRGRWQETVRRQSVGQSADR